MPLTPDDSGCLGSFGDRFSTLSAQATPADPPPPSGVRHERLRRRRAARQDFEPAPERAASYSRFSSDLQRTESIADQQRICRDASDRNLHVVTPEREFADAGISGTKRQRAGLSAMLAAAEGGEFATLYLYSLSRLARESIITLPLLKKMVFKFKVRVISVSDGIDTNVTNWELIAAIMSFVSEQYLRDLQVAVLRGQEGIVLARLCVGDYCFGYRSEPILGSETTRRGRNPRPRKVYVICVETSAWVERIFVWFVRENWSIAAIARELTRLGVPKDHRSTNPVWSPANVRSILENEKYVGLWAWGTMKNLRDPETGQIRQELRDESETENWRRLFPNLRLLADELFDAAQHKLRSNATAYAACRNEKGRLNGSPGKCRGQALLSGLIECGACGDTFVCTGKRMYCPNHPKGQCPCATGLNRYLAEHLILNWVGKTILVTPEWLSELEQELAHALTATNERGPSEESELRRQLAEVESRRDNLLRLAEDGIPDPDLKMRLAERRRELHELRTRLQRMETRQVVAQDSPTRESLVADLQNLAERLRGSESAANEALRRLLGGKITVEEIKPTGKRHGFLRGALHMRIYDVANAMGHLTGVGTFDSSSVVSRVMDFVDPEHQSAAQDLRDRAWQMYSAGRLVKEIGTELKVNRNRIAKLLEEAAVMHGEAFVDGRSRRAHLARKHLEPPLFQKIAPQVMELFQRRELYATIAGALNIDINTVRKAVCWWHESNGLPAPDGRSRRLELEVKSRK